MSVRPIGMQPRAHHFAPVKQFGQRYCFIRDVDVAEWDSHPCHWDRERVLYDALAMSQLARPRVLV